MSHTYFSPPASYFHHTDAATNKKVQNVDMMLPAAAQTHVLIFKSTVPTNNASVILCQQEKWQYETGSS
jgi:hypothetical protein